MNSSNDPLLEIHNLLDDFENELSKIRAIWRQIEIDNPGFDPVSEESWQEKHARMWLHGATEVHECNELERWLYDAWRAWLDTAGIPKWNTSYDYDKKSHQYRKVQSQELGQMYYATDERFAIQEPDENEKLLAFIIRLAREAEDTGQGHRLHWRALKSFLDFVREHYPKEEVAFIEHIFPKKMDLHFGRIIRLILPEAYPIPEKTAAEILMELARRCRNGRPEISRERQFFSVLNSPYRQCRLSAQSMTSPIARSLITIFPSCRCPRGLASSH